MPYKSTAQRGWAHTEAGMRALGGAEKVAEWDQASRGMKLPKHAKKKKRGATPEQMHELDGYIKGKYGNRA